MFLLFDVSLLTNMVFAHSSQSKKQKFPVQTPMNRKGKLVSVCQVYEFVTGCIYSFSLSHSL